MGKRLGSRDLHVFLVSRIRLIFSHQADRSFAWCPNRYIREIYVPAAKFQVNLARALDWFQVELERVQAGTSKFITTNNTILCSAGPAENKVINLAIFNDPRQVGKHTPV